MAEKQKKDEFASLVDGIVEGMQEIKAKDIVCLNLTGVDGAVCNHFVVCHADSTTQVDAIANSVIKMVREKLDDKPWHKEGFENAEWILLDYVNVVAHVFLNSARDFYKLEDLWADAVITEIPNVD